MADSIYSTQALLDFLKQSAIAGHLNPATARSRRHAAEQLLTQLNSVEAADLRELNVDDLCARFHKLQGSSIRPETLKLYNSRLKAALTDYFSWVEDPDSFVASSGETRQLRKRNDATRRRVSDEELALEQISLSAQQLPTDLIAVPIRPDHVIYIQNLPLDLTAKEAGKVARLIEALADTNE